MRNFDTLIQEIRQKAADAAAPGTRSLATGTRTSGAGEAGTRLSQSTSSRSSAPAASTAPNRSAAAFEIDGAAASVNVVSAGGGGGGDGRTVGGGRKSKKRTRKKKHGGSAAVPAPAARNAQRPVETAGASVMVDDSHSDSSSGADMNSQLTKITLVCHLQ